MPCNCVQIQDLVYYDELPSLLISNLDQIDSSSWYQLFKCSVCGQYWRVDNEDRLQERYVLKIKQFDGWQNIDITILAKQNLLASRGGTNNEICIWQDCANHQVKGVLYCIDHLWQTGARR